MSKYISMEEVIFFKGACCNENDLIAKKIKEELQKEFVPPILDVGCGIGDIAYNALKDLEVIGIDINKVESKQFPLRKKHQRIKANFFEYTPVYPITTLFISHTLQFLDHDLEALNNKVVQLNPSWIICVLNRNDDFLGQLISWADRIIPESRPERRHDDFPKGYILKKTIPFTATLACSTFEVLMEQISYLLLFEPSAYKQQVLTFLQENLENPSFTINQDILIYGK